MMDMDSGLRTFAAESRELLEQAEDTLLQLEERPDDPELLNQLFRSIHTIKGAAGIFRFDAVVGFTHVTENVLGRLREGELPLDGALMSLLLKARDHIVALVEEAFAAPEGPDPLLQEAGAGLVRGLQAYLGTIAVAVPADAPAAAKAASAAGADGGFGSEVENRNWHISLRFGQDVLRMGMDPLSFIHYLGTVGEIVSLTTVWDRMPPADEMDPETCYLGFEIDLDSPADKATIEDVFEFVQEDCTIHILPPHSRVSEYKRLIEAVSGDELRLGEILTLSGALTPRELEEALSEQKAEAAREVAPPRPIGEVMVGQGVVESEVVEAALGKQQKIREDKAREQQVVRVDAGKLESLLNLVGELVIAAARARVTARRTEDAMTLEAAEGMSRLVEEIRDTALGLRMVPIGDTFNRFRRVVRELGRELGKDVELRISGGETELDKTVVEKIGDPLMHLIRNAIDHGIEGPGVRAEANKPAKGHVSLNAFHDSGSIVIEVSDDGAGLPRDKILAKARDKGLARPDQELSDRDVYRLIFEPGLSTAEQVTNVSGRGVGMDVVRRNIETLRGLVDVDSTPGGGTRFSIRLPLTLAIIDGFQVKVGTSYYVIPLDLVDECIELDDEIQNRQGGGNYVNLRGEVLPYLRLSDVFRTERRARRVAGRLRDNIVVVQFGDQRAGLVVDELLGEHQTVIKPLGRVFQRLRGFSGATILGTGDVAMIVDVPRLIDSACRQSGVSRVAGGAA